MQTETHRIVRQTAHTLQQLDGWIEKAKAHATARKFDANVLLQARLAPDMFALNRQFAAACDNAKLLAGRTTGKTPPAHGNDNQQTFDEISQRIREVVAWLGDLTEADFAKAGDTRATFSFRPGIYLEADPYVYSYALPNFYFHASMVYAILRANGVDLGKSDFLGPVPFKKVEG